MKLKLTGNWESIILGSLLGFVANLLVTYHYVLLIQPYLIIVWCLLVAMLIYLFARDLRNILGDALKTRILFIGISLSSVLFAFWDFVQFYALGQHYMAVSFDPPYVMLGGVPLPSLLFSLALGGLFSIMERLIDILRQ